MSIELYQKQIEEVKADKVYTEQEKKNITAYYELQIWKINYDAQQKTRAKARRRAWSLAKQILKRVEEIAAMQTELGNIYYYDGLNRSFTHAERTSDPKCEPIRKAMKIGVRQE